MGFDLRKCSDQELGVIIRAAQEVLAERNKERGKALLGYSLADPNDYEDFCRDVAQQTLETLEAALAALQKQSNQYTDPDYLVKQKSLRMEIAERKKHGGNKPWRDPRKRRKIWLRD